MPQTSLRELLTSLQSLKRSRYHVRFTLALALISAAVLWCAPAYSWLAWLLIFITDGYLVLMLWCTASVSAGGPETWPKLPDRQPAVLVVFFVLMALMCSFGALYLVTRPGLSSLEAACLSFINLASFTYAHGAVSGWRDNAIQAGQLASGMLLLLCALPLLVSRFTNLDDDTGKVTVGGLKVTLLGLSDTQVTVSGGDFVWSKDGHSVTAKTSPITVTFGAGAAAGGPSQKRLVIEPDGRFTAPA